MIPIKGMKAHPYGLPMMMQAWGDFVIWAIGNISIRNKYFEETGNDLDELIGLDCSIQSIDQLSYYHRNIIIKFLDWSTEQFWGTIEEYH